MASWIGSGHLVEAILVMIVFEWFGLAVFYRATGRGIDPKRLGPNLLSGFFLMLALRAALLESSWIWVAAALTGALLAHLADLAVRWSK